MQIVLQHYCKTSWIAMLRVLPPTNQTYLVTNQLSFLAWKEPSKLCSVTPFLFNVDRNFWSLNKAYLPVRKLIGGKHGLLPQHGWLKIHYLVVCIVFTFILRILHCKISLITWPFKYAKNYNSFLGTQCSTLYFSEPKTKIKDKTR